MASSGKSKAAANAVLGAVAAGTLLVPGRCELCESAVKLEGHHWRGYDYPVDVWWICSACNKALRGKHDGSLDREQAREFVVAKRGEPAVIAARANGRQPSEWRNRIVGHGESAPDQLLANEKNWRIHPFPQQQALAGVLSDVGYVQSVIVNKRTSELWSGGMRGVETVVDGHMRVEIAISKGQPSIPVVYVDLDPAEEAEVLSSFDPISAMATADAAKLDELLREVQTGDEALAKMLADLAKDAGVIPSNSQIADQRERSDKTANVKCPECGHEFTTGGD